MPASPKNAFLQRWTVNTTQRRWCQRIVTHSWFQYLLHCHKSNPKWNHHDWWSITLCLMDGMQGFSNIPSDSEDIQYSIPAFKDVDLSNTKHMLELTTFGADLPLLLVSDCSIHVRPSNLPNRNLAHQLSFSRNNHAVTLTPAENGGMSKNKSLIDAIIEGTMWELAVVLGTILLLDEWAEARKSINSLARHTGIPFDSSRFISGNHFAQDRVSQTAPPFHGSTNPDIHRSSGHTLSRSGSTSCSMPSGWIWNADFLHTPWLILSDVVDGYSSVHTWVSANERDVSNVVSSSLEMGNIRCVCRWDLIKAITARMTPTPTDAWYAIVGDNVIWCQYPGNT